jgi:NAD(P)H-dependent FMN reductase
MIIAGISGSLSSDSLTRRALELALDGARGDGIEIDLIDLRELPLPFCDARDDEESYPPPVRQFRARISRASGLVIATPEYHNSLSGVLKNALDLLSTHELGGKVVGLVGVAGGAAGAINSLAHLRIILRAVGAWVVPQQVSVPHSQRTFDDEGRLLDAALADRLPRVGREVAKFARLHHPAL